ncbi:ABC-2 type transport system permease protein [Halovenus aranensis]|uniref:ABC-2 type transport system permease protein n=1 Tax=Halovenus aranensis TaxID=890420 RepID=A0A1G8ZIM1_9EURY|nr:ABC transporter permease subunit [Halovenus aranensis]SDK14878.1 ABC-2 type transport system permease protein [Halovenus aranensis]
MSTRKAVQTLVVRELVTLARSRAYYGLIAGVFLVSVGVLFAGGGAEAGYVPAAVDLLLPFELLVPAVAVALGYRTVTDDAQRGELDVLKTYPVPPWAYVLGVYAGRALALCAALVGPLALIGLYLSTQSPPDPATLATHQGIDSPALFVRFGALTLVYGLVTLALATAVSALAWSRRTAIVLAVVALTVVVAGIDLVLLRGFGTGWIADQQLTTLLAASPASAYRGLVFETVLYAAFDTETGYAAPGASAIGLFVWFALTVGVTVAGVSRAN